MAGQTHWQRGFIFLMSDGQQCIAGESLTIAGWVAMWRPMSKYL
jgi:hypothetical protein